MEEKDHSSSSTVMKYDIVASIAPSLIATYYWWLANSYIRLTHQNPCLHLIRWNFPWGMVPLLDFFAYAPPQGLVGLLQFLFFPSVRDKMNQCSLKIKKKEMKNGRQIPSLCMILCVMKMHFLSLFCHHVLNTLHKFLIFIPLMEWKWIKNGALEL